MSEARMTDAYAVIGNPIDFSKSPFIHMSFAQSTGQDMTYVKILGPLGQFKSMIDQFRSDGGKGLNITAPFKLDAFDYATERSPAAELAGASNALRFEGKKVIAENFDGVGLVRDVVHNLGQPLKGKRVLLLGAGGAARGALLPFLTEEPELLTIANRTESKADQLVEIANKKKTKNTKVNSSRFSELHAMKFDVIFNATSASLRGELPAVPATVFDLDALAYELAYAKGLTPFLRLAQNAGVQHLADGVGMLVEQAAEAFYWWRGVRPSTSKIIKSISVPLI
jgi:shikimate dehydrogenase